MDRKSLIIVVVCVILMFGSKWLDYKLYPPKKIAGTNSVATGTNLTSLSNATAEVVGAPAAALSPGAQVPSTASPGRPDWAAVKEETEVITNGPAIYTFSSLGGGLKQVELTNYPEIMQRSRKASATNALITLNRQAPLPALISLGDASVQGDGIFKLSQLPGGLGVRAEKTLTNGVRLVKDFTVSSNYLLMVSARVENTSGTPLAIPAQEWLVGTATPMNARDAGLMTLGVFWFNGAKPQRVDESWFANRTFGCFPGTPRTEYRAGASNVFWAAVYNQFFAMAVVPNEPALEVVSRRVLLPKPTPEQIAADSKLAREPHGYQTSLVMPAQTLAPNGSAERTFTVYAGPKEYKTLSRLGAVGKDLDAVMGFDANPLGGRFSGFFAKLLLLAMNGLQSLTGIGYGWVIIAITVIIKLLLWPLTTASTRSMKRMQALQPEMKKLQAKYKDDPTKLNQKTMEFWKEHKVNPLGGCLPMLFQLPIFLGFYTMIASAIELRGARFLWAFDLSQPDTIFFIPGLGGVPFLGVPGVGFPVNPLSLVMTATMIIQTRLIPPSPGMDPMQQKMMKYMPLMFVAMLYNYSAGMTLYWTCQNLLTIVQTKLTNASVTPAPVTPARTVLPAPPVKKRR